MLKNFLNTQNIPYITIPLAVVAFVFLSIIILNFTGATGLVSNLFFAYINQDIQNGKIAGEYTVVAVSQTEITINPHLNVTEGIWEDIRMGIGDIDGDGKIEFVVNDRSTYPADYQMKAIDDNGRDILWTRGLGYKCSVEEIVADNSFCWEGASFIIWDIDSGYPGEEIVVDMKISGSTRLAILNGRTGEIIRHIQWPLASGSPDRYIHQMTVAYLDGVNPSIVIQSGIYSDDYIAAYDKNLNRLWRFDPQDHNLPPSGGHFIFPQDWDGDGRDEIVHGSTLLNEDGTLFYSLGQALGTTNYHMDADASYIWDFHPGFEGNEAIFCIEGQDTGRSSQYEGVFMVNLNSKQIIWKETGNADGLNGWDHCHNMCFGDYLPNEGLEIWAQGGFYTNGQRDGYRWPMYSANAGTILTERGISGDSVEWDGDEGQTETMHANGVYRGRTSTNIFQFNNFALDKNDHISADFNNNGKETIIGIGDDGLIHLLNQSSFSLPLERNIYDRWYWIIRSVGPMGHWNWMPKSNAFGNAATKCSCKAWQNNECGGGICPNNKMSQIRTCNPSGCQSETQCVSHQGCTESEPFEENFVINIPIDTLGYQPEDLSYTMGVGDFNGDEKYDYIVRVWVDNDIPDEKNFKTITYAFDHDGTFLWDFHHNIAWSDYASDPTWTVILSVWDMDGDGKDEVITQRKEGTQYKLAMLNGETGQIKKEVNISRPGSYNHATIAYLDGRDSNPYLVRTYGGQSVSTVAYNKNLAKAWEINDQYHSETNIYTFDFDGDLKDEIVNGPVLLDTNSNGQPYVYFDVIDFVKEKYRLGNIDWAVERSIVADVDPNNPGLEWYVTLAGANPGDYFVQAAPWKGPYLFDIDQKKLLWHHNINGENQGWGRLHRGWVAEVDTSSPGLEIKATGFFWETGEWKNALDGVYGKPPILSGVHVSGYSEKYFLFAADGTVLKKTAGYNTGYPVYWDDDENAEYFKYRSGELLTQFDGSIIKNQMAVAHGSGESIQVDILGDWREEIIIASENKLHIYTNIGSTSYPNRPSPRQDHNYLMNMASYATGLPKPLMKDTQSSAPPANTCASQSGRICSATQTCANWIDQSKLCCAVTCEDNGGNGGVLPKVLSADFNCDNKIDIQDFGILLSHWHKLNNQVINYQHSNCESARSIDLVIDKNNKVNIFDLSLLLSCWGMPDAAKTTCLQEQVQ